MLNSLITSQTRIRLLKKFFLNSNIKAHLRGLEAEFGESSNGIRIELNRFEEAGLLTAGIEGNRKMYKANTDHPLFNDIHSIVIKDTGLDKLIENIIHHMNDLICLYLIGDSAHGKDSNLIELLLVGRNIDESSLSGKVMQAEKLLGRRVTCQVIDADDADDYILNYEPADLLPLWSNKISGVKQTY